MRKIQFTAAYSRGYTLVELMVGLVLSLFISGIALTYMASSAQSFRVLTNDSIIQENARFALEVLTQNFRLAGLNQSNNFSNVMDVIYSSALCSSNENGVANGSVGSTACTLDSLDNNSDRVAIDYMVSARNSSVNLNFTGCNGQSITVVAGSETKLASVFWSADIDGDGIRSLYCQTYNLDTSLAAGAAMPLIDGVDRLQVQFGVDTTSDGVINRYQSFTNLIALDPANARQVRAVRLALLLNSGTGVSQDSNTETLEANTYMLLDAFPETITDRKLRQIFSTTVLIPNTL